MAGRLFDLFDENVKSGRELATSPARSLSEMTASGSLTPGALEAKIDLTSRVQQRVDYSDFSNFVFFNSALDYFNISADRLMGEYPYDGTYEDQLRFLSESDGYQTYLYDTWPRWSGTAVFNSGVSLPGIPAYVYAADVGISGNDSQTGMLSPGTGSMTYEYHLKIRTLPTGVSDRVAVVQHSYNFYSPGVTLMYDRTGTFYAKVIDSSGTSYLTPPIVLTGSTTGSRYMGWSFSRENTGSLSWRLYVTDPDDDGGYQFQRPYVAASGTASVGYLPTESGYILVGYGGLAGVTIVAPDFEMNEFRIWRAARTADQLYANYNTRVYSTPDLLLYWRFMDQISGTQPNSHLIVRDYSGHKINGVITYVNSSGTAFYQERPSGNGMSPQDMGELKLSWDDVEVTDVMTLTQASASSYDRDNSNIITRLVPAKYLELEDEVNTSVLRNMLYLLGRQFDELKVMVDGISKTLLPSYDGHGDVPDALLDDALKFWGWDTKANFLSKEAFQYFFGYNVLSGAQADYDNQRLDTELYRIKNEFYRRTLQNLPYIYKRKGTREAAEALLRVYGMDEKIVKLKEFGYKPDVGIATRRINSEKSAYSLYIGDDGAPITVETTDNPVIASSTQSFVCRLKIPRYDDVPLSVVGTNYLFTLANGDGFVEQLYVSRTGTELTAPWTYITWGPSGTNFRTFGTASLDSQWHSIIVTRSGAGGASSSMRIDVADLDEDVVVSSTSYVMSGTIPNYISGNCNFTLGYNGQYWVRDVQVWNLGLSEQEKTSLFLNPFSFGADSGERLASMSLRWEFDKDMDEQYGTGSTRKAYDSSLSIVKVTGAFSYNQTYYESIGRDLYTREVFDYNFIAPVEYGWNEEKVRSVDSARVDPHDRWNESNVVSLEFNLVDALNEDISMMLSGLERWNNVIGDAANRYRDDYPQIEAIRRQYFARLSNRVNFRVFADFLDFFDRSFVSMVRKLLPARANFKGEEFVVESHMLERPKVQYTYRRQDAELAPEGTIVIYRT